MKRIVVIAAVIAAVTFGAVPPQASAATNTKAPASKKATTVATVKAEKKAAPVIVTVAEGDTLSSIAEAHETTWVRIYNANEQIANPDIINPGDQLRIPTADETLTDRTLPAAPVKTAASTNSTQRTKTTVSAASYPVDANSAKAYIYARESGNNPNATNPNGCYGLGQDCNGVLRAQCGADYACQDQFFTNYAMRRYGSWEGALAFWQNHHWW
jgi:LysM repeat protein